MVLIRVLLSSVATTGIFAVLGNVFLFSNGHSESGVVLIIGLVGAVVGAIAAGAHAIVEQLRNNRAAGPASTQP